MQLLARIKRKNCEPARSQRSAGTDVPAADRTDSTLSLSTPTKPPIVAVETAPKSKTNAVKPQPSRTRSGFRMFTRATSDPPTMSDSSPASTSTSTPHTSSPSSPAARPDQALPSQTPTNSTTPARPQLYRVPSVMYCPVLDINGKGYGNEESRRTCEF
jgi:hypothetical protein